ncbi:hypothetical protein [Sphingosinithalassobacter portus]|uniref:hypothetical protein n=1 Tax=Stakelama portus TaxID=2676234 RepID=UPI000D6EADBA|nr:hypothetical protein [Sphingosinithalassobacter portus]
MAALKNRLKAAALGFGITVAPLAIVAIAQFIFMPQIVAAGEGLDSNDKALALSYQQMLWFTAHTIVAILFAIYWFLVALLGKGQILRCRAANRILNFCVVAYLTITLYSILLWTDGEGAVCSFLGISDTDALPYVLDAMSSCDSFFFDITQFLGFGLLGLIVPFIISLIVRIVSSRRVYKLQNDAPLSSAGPAA